MRKGNKPSFTKRRITKYDAKQERWERALNECTVDVFIMHNVIMHNSHNAWLGDQNPHGMQADRPHKAY